MMQREELRAAVADAGYTAGELRRVEEGQMGEVFMNDTYVFKARGSVNEDGIRFQGMLDEIPPDVVDILSLAGVQVLVEERIAPTEPVAAEDFEALGALLRRLHREGRAFRTGDRLPAYEYQDRFGAWDELAAEAVSWKRERLEEARDLRQRYLPRVEDRLEELAFAREPVFFQHRDVILENILKSGSTFYITDFEFAALGYQGIELFRFVVDGIINNGPATVEPLLTGYLPPDASSEELVDGLDICLNYFLFNTFPFYRDLDEGTIQELADQRDTYLTTLIENMDRIEDALQTVTG